MFYSIHWKNDEHCVVQQEQNNNPLISIVELVYNGNKKKDHVIQSISNYTAYADVNTANSKSIIMFDDDCVVK